MVAAARTDPQAVLERLQSSDGGLSGADTADRLARIGPNIVGSHRVRALTVLAGQIRNPLILLLLLCAGVSGLTGDPTDAVIIAVIVGLSIALGFFNEYRAEVAVAALHDRDPPPGPRVEGRPAHGHRRHRAGAR